MVYIVLVNPIILGKAGMDPGAVFVATCIAAAVSTFVMAFYANYPIALARLWMLWIPAACLSMIPLRFGAGAERLPVAKTLRLGL